MSNMQISKLGLPSDIEAKLNRVDDLSEKNLNKLASQISNFIMNKIQNAQKSVDEAKQAAQNAENMSTKAGWFERKTTVLERRQNAIAHANTLTNSAIQNLNELITSSIALTRLNYALSCQIHKEMASSVAKGFMELNNNQVELSENGKKQINMILESAKTFAEQNTKNKKQFEGVKTDIKAIDERVIANAENISKNFENILSNKDNIAKNKSQIEGIKTNVKVMDERVIANAENISKNFENILSNKDNIAKNKSQIQINTNSISANKTTAKMAIILAIVSICISALSIGISIFALLK